MDSFMKQNIIKPKTLGCYICGRQFGTRSLTLHLKSCKEKFKIQKDQKIDKSLKIKLPQQPVLLEIILSQIENGMLQDQLLEKYNEQARNVHKYKVLPSCKYCGRTFNEESLLSHLKACSKKGTASDSQQKSGYKLSDDMKKPRTLACCLCGREFGLTSLKIHYPQCKEKFKNEELKKPFKQRNPIPEFSKQDEEMINSKEDWTLEEINEFNERATENYRNKALVQCRNCKRKFLPESYQRHLKNCKLINGDKTSQSMDTRQKPQNAKDTYEEVIKKPKVLMCHICGRQFGLTSLKIHQKSCVEKWINEQKKRPKSQRRAVPQISFDNDEVFNLDEASEWDLGKIERYNELANQVYKGCALFPCQICGKKFFEESLARHLNYCQKNAQQKRLKQQEKIRIQQNAKASQIVQKSKKLSGNNQTSISSNNLINKNNSETQQERKAPQEKALIETIQDVNETKNEEVKQDSEQNFNSTIKQVNEELQSTSKKNGQDDQEQVSQQQKEKPTKLNEHYSQQHPQNTEVDRIECKKCGRKFASDRIEKHESICKGESKRLPKHVNKVEKQDKVASDNAFLQKNSQNEIKLTQKKFKQDNQKNNDPSKQLVECKKCGKKFMPTKIEKHESNCKDIAFRAKNKSKKEETLAPENSEKSQKEYKPIQNEKDQNSIEVINTQSQSKNQQPLIQNQIKEKINLNSHEKTQQTSFNLIKCKYCNRKFGQERIQKHQNVCLNRKQFEAKQIQNIASKIYDVSNNKITGLTKIQTSKISQNNLCAQKDQQSEKIQNLLPCSKCGRKFASQRVEKHQNICKGPSAQKIINHEKLLKKQSQYVNKNEADQLIQLSKQPQNMKKNNFHIKTINKNQHQKEKLQKNGITSSQIFRKQNVKENLQITEQIINKIWDTKQPYLKPIQKIDTKNNLNQIKQNKVSNLSKNSLRGEFQDKNFTKQKEQQIGLDFIEVQKIDRVACKKCGRKFATDRIAKHEEICKSSKKNNQQPPLRPKLASISKQKMPLKSAQKFIQPKQQQLPEPQKIFKQFKEIKNMKISDSFIDNELERQFHETSTKNPINEIKNSGFNRVRNTFGGGEKFYSRKDNSPGKIENLLQRQPSKSPKQFVTKKWFK